MNSDVRAAAERVTRCNAGESIIAVYPTDHPVDFVRRGYAEQSFFLDLETLANAYLAEHPADENEPVGITLAEVKREND